MHKANFISNVKLEENFCVELDLDFVTLKWSRLTLLQNKQLPASTVETSCLSCTVFYLCSSLCLNFSRQQESCCWPVGLLTTQQVFIHALHKFIKLISKVFWKKKKKIPPVLHLVLSWPHHLVVLVFLVLMNHSTSWTWKALNNNKKDKKWGQSCWKLTSQSEY